MTEPEWQDHINDALAEIGSTSLRLENDSIAHFRLLIGRLDHMVFQGYHMLYKPPPTSRPSIDLTD